MMKASQLYKKMSIVWSEAGSLPFGVCEKLTIKNDSIKFSRTTSFSTDGYIDDREKCNWSIKTDSDGFEEKFSIMCNYFLRHMKPNIKIEGWDMPVFAIEVIRYDNTRECQRYNGDLLSNGFDKLVEMLKEFIPSVLPMPYLIEGYKEYDDEF